MNQELSQKVKTAMQDINSVGFSVIDLKGKTPEILGKPLYLAMDKKKLHANRDSYYNEIAFYFPDDWKKVSSGLKSFHDESTTLFIHDSEKASRIIDNELGLKFTPVILGFTQTVNNLVTKYHCGLKDNELKLARCMIRQMNERHNTSHLGSEVHEDQGYTGRAYRQMVSAILTTYGTPTISDKYSAKVGEMLIFNAKDRRVELGLDESKAFLHRGPKSGPKLLFFFEFLGVNPKVEIH